MGESREVNGPRTGEGGAERARERERGGPHNGHKCFCAKED